MARLLHVGARQVQYLRETGTVVPSVVGHGRGNSCFYNLLDVVKVHVALVDLTALDLVHVKRILDLVTDTQTLISYDLGPNVIVHVDLAHTRSDVEKRFPWQSSA